MLWQRVFTALLLLPVVIGIVFFLPIGLFASVLGAVLLIGAWEWAALVGKPVRTSRILFTVLVAILMVVVQQVSPPYVFWPSLNWPAYDDVAWFHLNNVPLFVLSASVVFWLISPVLLWFYPTHAVWWRSSITLRWGYGLLQLIGVWVALISLRRVGGNIEPYTGAFLIMFVLLLVWAADVGGYVFGRWLGKRKMAPNISPGKTWVGFFGGVGLAMVVGYISKPLFDIQVQSNIGFIALLLLTVVISVVGDLMESVAKRESGLKDSGRLLPGHGGLLDRIDSLIAAAPIFALGTLLLEIR